MSTEIVDVCSFAHTSLPSGVNVTDGTISFISVLSLADNSSPYAFTLYFPFLFTVNSAVIKLLSLLYSLVCASIIFPFSHNSILFIPFVSSLAVALIIAFLLLSIYFTSTIFTVGNAKLSLSIFPKQPSFPYFRHTPI